MKIAIFADCFLPITNGVVISVLNTSKKLAMRGHKILLITSYQKGAIKRIHPNISIKFCRSTKLFNMIKCPDCIIAVPNLDVIRSMNAFKPDIIHSHLPTFIGWEAVFCSRLLKIPLIGTYHTLIPEFLGHYKFPDIIKKNKLTKKIVWEYTKLYFNRCNRVIVPSHAMQKELQKHGIERPFSVLSNGVDLSKFYPRKSKKTGRCILYVGRISCEKNIDVIINAFKIVSKKNPCAVLMLAGSGPDMERLKKQSEPLLGKSIKFLGHIAHENLPKLYSQADLFATASTIETEGIVVLEAMACGLPIIGVNKLALPELVTNGKNGFIAEPYNHLQIAELMEKLLEDGKLRARLSKNSLKESKKYSLTGVVDEIERIYATKSL